MDSDESNLDDILRAATEAGIRLPFTVADLRRWAEQRRRVPKGHKKRSGQFLPEINLPTPEARATTAPTVDDDVDELRLPGGTGTKSKASPWSIANVDKPKWILAREKKEKDAAEKRAAAKEKAAARKSPPTVKAPVTVARDAAKSARDKTATAAKDTRETYLPQVEENRAAAKSAKVTDQWLQDYADEVAAEARAAAGRMEGHLAATEAAYAKAQAAFQAKQPQIAKRHQAEAEAARDAAMRDKITVMLARAKMKRLAEAKPPKPFKKNEWQERYDNPPPGYRLPKDAREHFDLLGNNRTYSGIWIAEDEDSDKPFIQHHATEGTMMGVYTPEYRLAREKLKWERVQKFEKVSEELNSELKQLVSNMPQPKNAAEAKARDNAVALLIAQETGMRRGGKGTSFIKDKDDKEYTSKIETDEDGKKKEVPTNKVKTYGASTLQREHVQKIEEDDKGNPIAVNLRFRGKSAKWNNIRVTDPVAVKAIADAHARTKNGEKLFPAASGDAMHKLMNERIQAIGKRRGIKEAAEFSGDEDEDAEDSPVEAVAEGEEGEEEDAAAVGDDEDLSGGFGVHDTRRLWANTVAPEIFQQIMDEKDRLPYDIDELTDWIQAAALAASKRLGNQYQAFVGNYLSMLPFMDVINAMIEVEKAKSARSRGPLDPDDYWRFGARTAKQLQGKSVSQVLEEQRKREKRRAEKAK